MDQLMSAIGKPQRSNSRRDEWQLWAGPDTHVERGSRMLLQRGMTALSPLCSVIFLRFLRVRMVCHFGANWMIGSNIKKADLLRLPKKFSGSPNRERA